MTDVAAGCLQPLKAPLCLVLAASDLEEHARRPPVLAHLHLADADQADAGIAQLSFHESDDLLPQGFRHASTMVLLTPVLHTFSSTRQIGRTLENTPICQAAAVTIMVLQPNARQIPPHLGNRQTSR